MCELVTSAILSDMQRDFELVSHDRLRTSIRSMPVWVASPRSVQYLSCSLSQSVNQKSVANVIVSGGQSVRLIIVLLLSFWLVVIFSVSVASFHKMRRANRGSAARVELSSCEWVVSMDLLYVKISGK